MHKPAWPWTLTSLAVLTATWVVLTWPFEDGPFVQDLFLPGPLELWNGFVDLATTGYKGYSLLEHIGFSLRRVLAGFATGALAGTLLGLLMGVVPALDALADPFIEFLRPLPQLGYLVLLIVWFGIGETSRIVLLFLAALPVAAVAARSGVRNVPPQRIQVARSLGATNWQIFCHVVFPSALPEIFIGARLTIGIVYGTLIAAEIIAGSTGIGWMILDAGRFLRSDYVFVGIALIGLLGLGLDRLLVAIEARIIHWSGK
jgi:taurine transport system permease protein